MSNRDNAATGLNRRRFLHGLAGLATGGTSALVACGDPTSQASTNTPVPPTATAIPPTTSAPKTTAPVARISPTTSAAKADPNFIDAGGLQDFAATAANPKLVTLDVPKLKRPLQVFVIKLTDQNYTILSNLCTHQGCEIDWVAQDKLFECPCHGSEYKLDGQNVAGPAPSPLARYSSKIENGRLFISIKKEA